VRSQVNTRAPDAQGKGNAVPAWAATLLAIAVTIAGAVFGFSIAQDRRITRLEERVASLGRQMISLPKRKTD